MIPLAAALLAIAAPAAVAQDHNPLFAGADPDIIASCIHWDWLSGQVAAGAGVAGGAVSVM